MHLRAWATLVEFTVLAADTVESPLMEQLDPGLEVVEVAGGGEEANVEAGRQVDRLKGAMSDIVVFVNLRARVALKSTALQGGSLEV